MDTKITVIPGDGIGPEIMRATLRVLDALDAGLENQGELIPADTLDSIRRNRVLLKGPLTTPVGKGFRSINVSLRREFDLYANVRPVISMAGTHSHFQDIDIITVRENTQGAYLAADAKLSEDGTTAIATRRQSGRASRSSSSKARAAMA